jgi:hypothetical protein
VKQMTPAQHPSRDAAPGPNHFPAVPGRRVLGVVVVHAVTGLGQAAVGVADSGGVLVMSLGSQVVLLG